MAPGAGRPEREPTPFLPPPFHSGASTFPPLQGRWGGASRRDRRDQRELACRHQGPAAPEGQAPSPKDLEQGTRAPELVDRPVVRSFAGAHCGKDALPTPRPLPHPLSALSREGRTSLLVSFPLCSSVSPRPPGERRPQPLGQGPQRAGRRGSEPLSAAEASTAGRTRPAPLGPLGALWGELGGGAHSPGPNSGTKRVRGAAEHARDRWAATPPATHRLSVAVHVLLFVGF